MSIRATNRRSRNVGRSLRHRAATLARSPRLGPILLALLACGAAAAIVLGPLTGGPSGPPNSADRLIVWTNCDKLPELSDRELDDWKGRGVDGFVCMLGPLSGMGGDQELTGDPDADLSGDEYAVQRRIRDSRVVARAAERDMKLYLGAYLASQTNTATPLAEWFDDAAWSRKVLPKMADLAGAARQLGFAGIAFDQELYPQKGGVTTATWDWSYPGNERPEEAVRAAAKRRGRELMRAIVEAFPDVELVAYDVQFPESWHEVVQEEINGVRGAFDRRVDIDFWDGLSSVRGYRALRLLDATFYKVPHIGSWDNALRYNDNRLYSYLSRRLSNWSYAASRLYISPFAWIDAGESSDFERARPPDHVREQLLAFRRWGMGGEFADFAFAGPRGFDYRAYEDAMRQASAPAVVDDEPPSLRVLTAGGRGAAPVRGTANDNLAVRLVRWKNDRGRSGVARMTWRIRSGNPERGYRGEMVWTLPPAALEQGAEELVVTAEDIKGRTTTRRATLPPGRSPTS